MTCIAKKTKQNTVSKGGLDPLISLVIHCLNKEFLKCIWSFSLFTIQNASPIIATTNRRVHGVIANDK